MPGSHDNERLLEKLTQYNGKISERSYAPGTHIFTAGDKPQGIYYVNEGLVKVIRESEDGKQVLAHILGRNEFMGLVSLVRRSSYFSTAVAIKRAKVQFIPKHVFLKLLQTDIEFANAVVRALCEQLSSSRDRMAHLLTKSAKQRLAALLLSLELAYDEDERYQNALIRLSRKDIAAIIAVAPETISRYLAEFKAKGFITLKGPDIEIENREGLLRLSRVVI